MFTVSFAQVQKEKYHRVKIYYNSPQQFQQLEHDGIVIDHGIRDKNLSIETVLSDSELQVITSKGLQVDIIIEDLKTYYAIRNEIQKNIIGSNPFRNMSCSNNGVRNFMTPVNFNVFPQNEFGGYYTYSKALQEFDEMNALYPDLISAPSDIGSFLTEGQPDNSTTPSIGGNPIKWLRISDNPNTSTEGEPQILYTAIHHAREPASLSQLIFFMWYLLENYESDNAIKTLLDNTELYFVPVINPDGYLYNEKTDPNGSGFWRKNRKNGHGVDNNRNYNYFIDGDSNNDTWGGPGSSSNTNSELYHGTEPFSEIENQAIKWFVEQHNFIMALNNHTFGELLYYPFGYNGSATADDGLYQAFTDELVSQNGFNNLRDAPYSGDSDDFMYGTVGTHSKIFAMTPEIGNDFWPSANAIDGICKSMMYTNLTSARMVSDYSKLIDTSPIFIETTSSEIEYDLKRMGLVNSNNYIVSINPISSNIMSVGSPNSHNAIEFLEQQNGTIAVTLDPSISSGDKVVYELVVNNGNYNVVEEITKIFGQPTTIFQDSGTDTTTNWDTPFTSGWKTTTEDFISGPTSITDSPNGNYNSLQTKQITTANPIDLTGAREAYLTFFAKWGLQYDFDYVQIEVSIDEGVNWIPQCGKYTRSGGIFHSGANGAPVYDGNQSEWVFEEINLDEYLGETILMRFELKTNSAITADGFYFDDFQVEVLEDNLSLEEAPFKQVNVFPNPVKNEFTISSNLQNFDVAIYNLQGQLVYESRGHANTIHIDYSEYTAGIYILNIITENTSQSYKIAKQ